MFERISIWGRISYAICGFENYLISKKYAKEDWEGLLDLLWSFSDDEFYDEWLLKIAECLPETILEEETFDEEGDWDFVDEEIFYELQNLYQNTPDIEVVNTILQAIHNICLVELYTVAKPPAEKSLALINKLVQVYEGMKLPLPDLRGFTRFSIDTNDCWGVAMKREDILVSYWNV